LDIKLTLKSNNRTLEISKDTSYKLINIDGIDSGSLELNTVSNAQFDGSVVVSKRIQNRPISITVDYKGTNSQEVERQSLISFFNPKNKGLLIVNYGDIERAIEYEVEGFNCKLNSIFDTVSFTVDLLCPQPYWRDILESKINIAMWRGMFHFPLIMPSTVIPHTNPDSTWKDLSGNLNNGLLSGFNFDATSGWTTEGLKFDSDSYVTLPSLELKEGTIQVNNQVATFDKDTDYRTTSANSNIVSLNTTVDGVMDVEIGGNTLQNLIKAINTNTIAQYGAVASWQLFKPSTVYTIKITNKTTEIKQFYLNEFCFIAPTEYTVQPNGAIIVKATTLSSFTGGQSTIEVLIKNKITHTQANNLEVVVLEGDWTNKEIPYFEGIRSVGENEGNQIEIISKKSDTMTGDTQTLTLTNPLRGLPNNVRDIANGNGVTRNVGKGVFNGSVSENWLLAGVQPTGVLVVYIVLNNLKPNTQCISDKLLSSIYSRIYSGDKNIIVVHQTEKFLMIAIDNTIASNIAGFKAWLQANPVTVYYQLAIPTTEQLPQALKLKSFANGTLQVNTLIPPYLSANYPISLGGSLASNVSRLDLSNPLITTGLVKNYRVYNKILTTEEIARANTTNYLRGPALLVDLNSSYKELSKTGIIMGLREPSLIVNALNTGNVESGMIIEFKALGTLTNPSILNVETQEFFKINKSMVQGEVITVNTNIGAKKVIDNLNGVETNILNLIDLDSTFLQLRVGDNLLRYDADTNLDNLEVNIYYNPFYLGV